jgi:O-antigen/teichoic acid export membrane protein
LVFSNIVISGWIYSKNRYLLPRLRFFRLSKAKGILNLGFQFFIIQVAVIVIFTTDKILITQLFGPEYVTSYDVVFKLFSVVSILYTLMVGPLWSAYSDAYHRKDIKWIKNALKNQLKTYSIIFFVIVVMIFLARPIILLWTGHDYGSNIKLIICIAIFILVSTWNNIFAYFVNATNHLKVQLITAIIAIFANIPLSILLVKFFKFNVHGIVIATSVSLSLFSFCGPIQVYLILRDSK